MFRIECFVDDKKLSQVLQVLQGLILADPRIQPVANAHMERGTVKAKTDGSIGELLLEHIKKNKLKEIRNRDVREFLRGMGRPPGSSYWGIKEGIRLGYLRRSGKGSGMKYVVKS